jgi:prolyl-tRNA editing enzyme YbaK/EbsC (Cys-tRNA(Pro) deacylase)
VRTSVDVNNFLTEREVRHELVPTRGRLRSSERIAAVLDLPPEVVGKVIVFEGPEGPVAAVVPSGCEADRARVARASRQADAEAVSDERASELTGYLAESIPPAGLPDEFSVILDRSLHRDAVLYFPGGEARAVLKIRGKDLASATRATVASIALAPGRR